MINAIDLAREIGMGKRTNTILVSAFFTLLRKVILRKTPSGYMKEKATKPTSRRGSWTLIDRNHKHIDAGATASGKVDVPGALEAPQRIKRR